MGKLGILALTIALSGCVTMPKECLVDVTHISHPTLGPPFGPESEEGTIDSFGSSCRWEADKLLAEMGLAYKIPDSDLYGNDFIFIGKVAYKIWERQ